jgi:hypothetical protein
VGRFLYQFVRPQHHSDVSLRMGNLLGPIMFVGYLPAGLVVALTSGAGVFISLPFKKRRQTE